MLRISFAGLVFLAAAPALAGGQPLTAEPPSNQASAQSERLAAYRGDAFSQLALAGRYERGDGVAADSDLAADYAAAAGVTAPSRALPVLRELAQKGGIHARVLLGRSLLASANPAQRTEGEGVLTYAAAEGSKEADFILAVRAAVRGDRGAARIRLERVARGDDVTASLAGFLRAHLAEIPSRPDGPLLPGKPFRTAQFEFDDAAIAARSAAWGLEWKNRFNEDAVRTLARNRLAELAEATLAGDPFADYVITNELLIRCRGPRFDRPACRAIVDLDSPIAARTASGRSGLTAMGEKTSVGRLFELGVGGPVDYRRARLVYGAGKNQAGPDRTESAFRYANLLQKGLGGPADLVAAREELQAAAAGGHALAAYALAVEKLRARDFQGLAYYLRTAADAGNAEAAYYLAQNLVENRFTVREPQAAIFKYYNQAAAAGVARAFQGVAYSYLYGWGTPKDEAKARNWFEKAARSGDPQAAHWVGHLAITQGDPAGAIPWLKRAVAGGSPGAAEQLDAVVRAGYRERSLGGFLAGVFAFIGQAADGMAQAYQAQLDRQQEEIRFSMMVNAGLAANNAAGGSTSGASGGDRRETTGESAGSSVGSGGGDSDAVSPSVARDAIRPGSDMDTGSGSQSSSGAATPYGSSDQQSRPTGNGPVDAGDDGRNGGSANGASEVDDSPENRDGRGDTNGAIIVKTESAAERAAHIAEDARQEAQRQKAIAYDNQKKAEQAARQRETEEMIRRMAAEEAAKPKDACSLWGKDCPKRPAGPPSKVSPQ